MLPLVVPMASQNKPDRASFYLSWDAAGLDYKMPTKSQYPLLLVRLYHKP